MFFVLASSSPRRISILQKLGLPLIIFPPRYEPRVRSDDPRRYAELTALEKARSVAGYFDDSIVIGVDTIVTLDGEIIGKPRSDEDAKKILRMLSGRKHEVISGVALIDTDTSMEVSSTEVTRVWIRNMSDEDIEWYIRSREPMDKAGAYAIQGLGSLFIERIDGDFWNVVGFPIGLFRQLLGRLRGIDLLHYLKPQMTLI